MSTVGSTIVESGDRILNDNGLKCGVIGAYNLPIIEWTRLIDTDTPKPGYFLRTKAGSGGEDSVQDLDLKGTNFIGMSETDFGQVATSDTAYAAGDEIPIIPSCMNPGALLRNIHFCDPTAAYNSEQPVTVGSTAGTGIPVIEATLQTGSSAGGLFQTITVATLGAAGTYILPRIFGRMLYYGADPSAAFQDAMSLVHGG